MRDGKAVRLAWRHYRTMRDGGAVRLAWWHHRAMHNVVNPCLRDDGMRSRERAGSLR